MAEESGDGEKVKVIQDELNELEERAEALDRQRTKNISAIRFANETPSDSVDTPLCFGLPEHPNTGRTINNYTSEHNLKGNITPFKCSNGSDNAPKNNMNK